MQRMGLCNRLRPEKAAEYIALHAAGVAGRAGDDQRLQHPQFLVFFCASPSILFAFWEYHGEDFAADARKMAADPSPANGGR